MQQAIEHAKTVRQRLRRPLNAVPDSGIDLRRGRAAPVKSADRCIIFAPSQHTDTLLLQRLKGERQKDVPFSEIKLSGIIRGHFPFQGPNIGGYCRIEDIHRAVAAHFNITAHELISERRTKDIARPRQISMWLCKKLTEHSLPMIGRLCGKRDHTTVLHAVRKIDGLLGDRQIREALSAVLHKLGLLPDEYLPVL